MSWRSYNPNPVNQGGTGDCVIRALTKAIGKTWDEVYWDLCVLGFYAGDWGNSNQVWRQYLKDHGFRQRIVPNTCPMCYTVADFCRDHPEGVFVLATGANGGNHAVAALNGDYYDAWDSGKEIPAFYFSRR